MNTDRRKRFTRRAAALAWAAVAGVSAAAAGGAQPVEPPPGPAQPTIPLGEFMDLTPLAVAEDVRAIAGALLADRTGSGASAYAATREVEYLTLHEAVNRSLKSNLEVLLRRDDAERLREVLLEAQAVYDPVFEVAVSYTRNNTSERRFFGTVLKKKFVPQTPIDIPINPNKSGPQVDQLGFRRQAGGEERKHVAVSERPKNDTPDQQGYSVTISQQLPWGASYDITTAFTDKRVFYDDLGHSYGANWTASLVANLAIALPGSKNFGPYATVDTGIKVAAKDEQRGFWEVKAAINRVLAATDTAYWQLVGRLEALAVVHENRRLVESQAAATDRLFQARLVTAFGKAQVDAELARVKVLEEAARRDLITASNALASLITGSSAKVNERLVLPIGYAANLVKSLDLRALDAFEIGLGNRPELRAAQVAIEAGPINRAFGRVQARPDFSFFASAAARQRGDPFGYRSPAGAARGLVNPDSFSFRASLVLVRPLGNRAANARHDILRRRHADLQLALRELENAVEKDVGDALALVHSAREQIAIADRNVELAALAHERLLRRRARVGGVPELELVTASRNLLAARSARVAAVVDHKVAEGRLLAAQGIIANQYAYQLAGSAFERHRLELLAANGRLRYFAPLPGAAGPAHPPRKRSP